MGQGLWKVLAEGSGRGEEVEWLRERFGWVLSGLGMFVGGAGVYGGAEGTVL